MSNSNIDSDFIFNIQLDEDIINNTHNIIENSDLDNVNNFTLNLKNSKSDTDLIENINLSFDNTDSNIIENTNIDNCHTGKNCVPIKIHTGVDGISAYELALRKGFIGTEDEWLQLLYFNRDVFLSESEYALLVQNDAVDLTKKYLIYEDDN